MIEPVDGHMASLTDGTGSAARTRIAGLVVCAFMAASSPATASSALSALAPELVRGLSAPPANVVVAVGPLVSDVAAPKGDELAVRLAPTIAGQLGKGAHAYPKVVPLSVAQALGAKGGTLIYVQVEVARGQLRATADLYTVPSNGWDRARVPSPTPSAHAFASAPLDAEVRGYLPPLVLEEAKVHKARHDLGEVLAAACGDLDGDGGNELVLLSRSTVAWGHVQAGRFVAARSAPWASLGPMVAVPMRDPLASSVVAPRADGAGGDLFVGSTDRGGLSVARDLRAGAPLSGLPMAVWGRPLCAKPNPSTEALEGGFFDCTRSQPAKPAASPAKAEAVPVPELPASRYDAVAIAPLVGRDGTSSIILIAREPGGVLRIKAGAEAATLNAAGAQVAVGDLDQDGAPEIVTTSDGPDDFVAVHTLKHHELVPRLRIPTPAPVRALGVCPPEDGGRSAIVAVVGAEVWLVR